MERLKLWLETLNIRIGAAIVLDALKRFAVYIWVSLKDALSRKTTWVAIVCTALAFWTGGYFVGADKKREAYEAMNAAIDRMRDAKAAESTVRSELASANARIAALTNDLEELRKGPSTAPAPAPPKARPKPKPAAAAPEPSAWSWLR